MAQVKFNPALEYFVGQVGELIYKTRNGRRYVSRKPDYTHLQFNDAQKFNQQRFGRATRYAKEVMADPRARTPYEAAAKEKGASVQNLIVADYMGVPSVDEIDMREYNGQAGGKILIRASDDFEVKGVDVVISGPTGEEIEKGAAVRSPMGDYCWVYTATVTVPAPVRVEVTAADRPGNRTTKVESA